MVAVSFGKQEALVALSRAALPGRFPECLQGKRTSGAVPLGTSPSPRIARFTLTYMAGILCAWLLIDQDFAFLDREKDLSSGRSLHAMMGSAAVS